MNDFMALMTRQQNERELALALEQRRLLLGSNGADPRFRRNPSLWQRVWQRMQARIGRGSPHTAAAGSAMHSNA